MVNFLKMKITLVQPSTLHDFLTLPQLPNNEKKTNHSARVLTNSENLKLIREEDIKKANESKAIDLRKQQREKKAMEQEQKKKEVEERKLKRAVEKAEKERQKKLKKRSEESTSNLNLREKSTVGFVGGMIMIMIYLTSDMKNGKNIPS